MPHQLVQLWWKFSGSLWYPKNVVFLKGHGLVFKIWRIVSWLSSTDLVILLMQTRSLFVFSWSVVLWGKTFKNLLYPSKKKLLPRWPNLQYIPWSAWTKSKHSLYCHCQKFLTFLQTNPQTGPWLPSQNCFVASHKKLICPIRPSNSTNRVPFQDKNDPQRVWR